MKRAIFHGLLVPIAFASLVAEPCRAQARPEVGFRSGYGFALGAATGEANDDLDQSISGQIPLWVDVGSRLDQNVFIGGYFSYCFGLLGKQVRDACEQGNQQVQSVRGNLGCKAHDVRLGFETAYHFGNPKAGLDPWLGLGLGYEWVNWDVSAGAQGSHVDLSIDSHGFEFLNLQAGLDVRLSEIVALGPFAALALGSYDTLTASCAAGCSGTASGPVPKQALHEWLFIGARVTLR